MGAVPSPLPNKAPLPYDVIVLGAGAAGMMAAATAGAEPKL